MAVITQIIANSLISGSVYALMAAGFSMMYALQRFMNIAHGATYVIGAFTAYALAKLVGLSFWIAFPVAILAAILAGVAMNEAVFRQLQQEKEKDKALLLSSFGLFLLVEALVLMLFGADIKTFGLPIKRGMDIFGAIVTPMQLIIIISAPIIFIAIWFFLKKTKLGTALRATADNETIASTMGVNARKMQVIITAIGSGLAGIAGILVGLEQNIQHSMGMSAVLKGLIAAVIGGIGNVAAAILGGYLLGLVENIGVWYLPNSYKNAISFTLLVIFLLFRPQGFFGVKKREEASE